MSREKVVMPFFEKFKGEGAPRPTSPPLKTIAIAAFGAFIAVLLLSTLTGFFELLLLIAPFGASSVLIFGYPDLPFAQPRNVIVGHFLSSCVGILFLSVFASQSLGVALAVAVAIALMMALGLMHPPAAANPISIYLAKAGWSFLVFPTLTGSVLLIIIALFYNNATRSSRYPKYW